MSPTARKTPNLPESALKNRPQPVEGDEKPAHQRDHTNRAEHELERLHDAVQIDLALLGRRHVKGRGEGAADGRGDGIDRRRPLHHDVDAIDEPGPGERDLSCGEVHDHQAAAVRPGDAARLEHAADGEGASPSGGVERERIVDAEPPSLGERPRHDERVRRVQKNERIVDLEAAGITGFVDADVCLVADVDPMHREELSRCVAGERGRAHHGDGQLDSTHAGDGCRNLLREGTSLSDGDLQRRAAGHRVDDLDEGTQHGAVDEIDGAHQRHAEGERHDAQREAAVAAAQEPQRQGEARKRTHVSPYHGRRLAVTPRARARDSPPRLTRQRIRSTCGRRRPPARRC